MTIVGEFTNYQRGEFRFRVLDGYYTIRGVDYVSPIHGGPLTAEVRRHIERDVLRVAGQAWPAPEGRPWYAIRFIWPARQSGGTEQ